MRPTWTLLAAALWLVACGGSEPEADPAPDRGTTHAGGEHHHAGHGGAHGHGHHDHSSPEALRPLMRRLYGDMGSLRGALASGDLPSATTHARAIAVACDDQDVHHVDPERFGPRFAEIDAQLHGAAAEMAGAAEGGDLADARGRYAALHAACVACHAHAPTAGAVDLSALAPAP